MDAVEWTGAYAGINGGGGFDTSNFAHDSPSFRLRGGLFGGTFGANWQNGWVVWGFETDLDLSNAHGSLPCGAFVCDARNHWLGTTRARLGGATGRWLPYVTIGATYGGVTASSTNPAIASESQTRLGWTAGIGAEYALGSNWSAKLEYLYVCLGNVGGGSVCETSVTTSNISIKQSVIRAGLNYKFHGPLLARE